MAEHYALKRDTSKEVELKKLHYIEQVKKMSAKHKWFLKHRHGMLCSLLIQDYKPGVIKPVLGVVSLVLFLTCFKGDYELVVKTQGVQILFLCGVLQLTMKSWWLLKVGRM